MNKRRAAILGLSKATAPSTVEGAERRIPSDPAGLGNDSIQGQHQLELRTQQLKDAAEKAGVNWLDFLTEQGAPVLSSVRKIRVPLKNGGVETYTVATCFIEYEDLVTQCVIDPLNVRNSSERTEEALADIIDEIGDGYQQMPIIGYRTADNKISIVEGSRRYTCGIIRKRGLWSDIFDKMPSEEAILYSVDAANKKEHLTDMSLGQMYDHLIKKWHCTAADFAQLKNIDPAIVSVRLNMFRSPSELKELLPTTKTTQRETKAFVAAANFISERKLVDAAVNYVMSLTSDKDYDSPNDKKIDVIRYLSMFVAEKKRRKPEPKPTAQPDKLYEDGRRTIVWQDKGRSSVLNMKYIPVEWSSELKELVADFVRRKIESVN
ncbi:hypothetical protein NTH44_003121 [Vibrio metoecus]|nr:hypothetical protein [Vibrio cholerae]